MTLSELIVSYRENNKLSQRRFAEQCGLSNGYISMLEKGENPKTKQPITPTIQKLKKLAKGMAISINELFNIVDDIDISLNDAYEGIQIDNIIPMPTMNKIPLLGTIACGDPILAEENIDEEISIPEHIKADFALLCKGDSMIDARINDGDIVYIRQQPTVENGEIAAVLIDTEATLKRVFFEDGILTLFACNAKYRPYIYTGEKLNEIKILGKAVGFTSAL